jgi:Ser/Thr protein kinase RdoA (MazF antagonist)
MTAGGKSGPGTRGRTVIAPAEMTAPPAEVLAAWGVEGGTSERVEGGLINTTFLVRGPDGAPRLVLQRLHPIFAAEVNVDIEAVTGHLAAAGMVTPRLVRTLAGDRWHVVGGATWRALTYIDGVTVHVMPDATHAEAAGELVGRFHRALADLDHAFVFQRVGAHDTAAHLRRLAQSVLAGGADGETEEDAALLAEGVALGREILDAGARLPPLGDLPRRPMHGDLKVSNIMFARRGRGEPAAATCVIDLDTFGPQTIAYEMGDALRSWCNPDGEDTADTRFDLDLFAGAVRGYASGLAGLLAPAEITSLASGLETVCVELAARFCADVFDNRYFLWNPDRFSSRRHHNLVRARGQLTLGRAVAAARATAQLRVAEAFRA